MRRANWLALVILAFGLLLVYGGFSKYRDQNTGTAGTAEVTGCEGGSKYDRGIHCRGTWESEERIVTGRVENAGYRDIGKTIDVRVHGDDHATKPDIGTSIMLWALGAAVGGFGLIALPMRSASPGSRSAA